MSSETISVKRHNHCVHPCNDERKEALLKLLLEKNAKKSILIVTNTEIQSLKSLSSESVVIVTDDELTKKPELKCEVLISYNLPDAAITYMVRLAHAISQAYILLDKNEHKKLYPIETLLGRALKQEMVAGFESDSVEKPKNKDDKKEYKTRKNNDRKKSNNQSRSKYLGKDENGKAIFSGKSGERNHRYDGTPKHNDEKVSTRRRTGKTINIKALKPKKESE